jgi:hypothetical protein
MAEPQVGEPPPFQYSTTIASDVPFTKDSHLHGVFFISDSKLIKTPYQYWLQDRRIWNDICLHFLKAGFDTFSFCPYTTRAAFEQFHPNIKLERNAIIPTAQDVAEVSNHPATPQRKNTQDAPPLYETPSIRRQTTTDEPNDEVAELRRRLQAQLDANTALRQAAQQQQQQQPAASPSEAILAQLAQLLLQQSTRSDPIKEPPMPTWDGDFTTKELYLERMDIYCKNKYFSSVTDWSKADLLHLDLSNYL